MILSTLPNKFTRATSNVVVLNNRLVVNRNLSTETVDKITKLHVLRSYFFDLMEMSEDNLEVRRINKIVTQIEFQLQKLWGFKVDERFHRWFEVPKCSCPKMDNSEYIGTSYRVLNPTCILHKI
jgi:hypothetical protein